MPAADEKSLQYLSAFSLLIVDAATDLPAPLHADQYILDGFHLARLASTYRPRLDTCADRPRALLRVSRQLHKEIEATALRLMFRAMGMPMDAILAIDALGNRRQLDARDTLALTNLMSDPEGALGWPSNDPLLDAGNSSPGWRSRSNDHPKPRDMSDEAMLVGALAQQYAKVVRWREDNLDEEVEEEESEEVDEQSEQEEDGDERMLGEDEDMPDGYYSE
ncbi:hypothetical protein HDZ31DRAFT_5349, partial [Schizophyllum fasciatum]